MLDKVKSYAVTPKAWVSHSYRTGDTLGQMNLDPDVHERYGVPFLVIHRPDLRRTLLEEAEVCGASIRLNTAIDIEYTDFEKGYLYAKAATTGTDAKHEPSEQIAAELVIAADGQQSNARAYLNPQINRPVPTGKMVNRILIGIERMQELGLKDLIDPPCIHVWLGPDSLAVGYLLKNVFNFVLTCSSEKEESVFTGPRPAVKEDLEAVFRDWDPRIRSLVENGHGFMKWLLFDNGDSDVSAWARAVDHEKLALALTGDAAHAIGPYM